MPPPQYKQEAFLLDAGPLGYLEGLTVSQQSNTSKKREAVCQYFGGVPYALPPVGQYRFRRPRPLPEHYRYGTKASPGRFTLKAATCPQPDGVTTGSDRSLWDEDCLQLNIYLPTTGERPEKGWPIFFYIHGGFLQWGGPNMAASALAPLLNDSDFRAIVVMPGYRLNLFGFLSSQELQAEAQKDGEASGNMGFWDQRTALEWTAKNIGHFGGNPNNITVAGYSAGAHSAFHQLAHELYFVPDEKALIKRTIMWSNSPGVQPRTSAEHQAQFDELLSLLNIPKTLSGEEKLAKLRSLSPKQLVDVQNDLDISEYRATSDDSFVSTNLLLSIQRGDFGSRMKRRGMKLINGECRDEHFLYEAWRTPAASYEAVRTRLIADYPETIVNKLMHYYCGEGKSLPPTLKDWPDLFGHIYADMQVHHLERGFHRALELGGLEFGKDVFRYRFNWRAKCVDTQFKPEWKVTHATDMAIWFWGLDYGEGLLDSEKELLKSWNQALAAFVRGDEVPWGPSNIKEMRRLRADGKTDVWTDDQWEEGLKVFDFVNQSGSGIGGWIKAKL